MEEKSAHVPPENMLNEELETLTISIRKWLPYNHLNGVTKNAKKMKFSNWSTIHVGKKFQGRFSKVFYTG